METVCGKCGRSFLLPLVATLVVIFVMALLRNADAATFPLYVTGTGSSNIAITGDAGTTNILDGSQANKTPSITILSRTAPTASSTRMQISVAKNTTSELGRVYFNYNNNAGFGSDVDISANATGAFYLSSSTSANGNSGDWFQFSLYDYNPASGTGVLGTLIAQSATYGSPGTGTTGVLVNVAFNNASYTLPKGHFLAVKITYHNGYTSNGNQSRTGYVYCNTTYQSKINVEMKTHIISTTSANGTINPLVASPGTSYDIFSTSSQTYTATAGSGYVIQSLTVDSVAIGSAVNLTTYPYTFSDFTRDHTISVTYITDTGTLIVAPGVGGSISLPAYSMSWAGGTSTSYTVHSSVPLNFIVTPDADYGINQVFVDGADQGVPYGQTTPWAVPAITIAPNTSRTLTVSFLRYYDVTASVSGNIGGTIDPAGTTAVLSGQALTFTIQPDNGYRLLQITDNGVAKGNNLSYSITNITATHNVVATFLPIYTIHSTAGPNGTITPIGDTVVDSGTNRNFSITPNMGFRIADVQVDGTSVGAVSSYTFTNVSAGHTIEVSFMESPIPSTYCAIPPYINTPAPPSVMLMLSVESPMAGPANPTVTCTGTPSSLSYSCSSSGLGGYDNGRNYYGYFESGKCYTYSGSGATGLFSPSGAATNHQCSAGTAWSGNMLNWATTLAVDAFRKAFTGGNRTVDTATSTVLLAAFNNGDWTIDPPVLTNAELYMPISGTNQSRKIVRQNAGSGFGVCNAGQTSCTVTPSGSGEARWPTAGTNTAAVYSLRIKACDSTGGSETRCNSTTNKPEGTIQKNMDKMRFALMSYTGESGTSRDGGVLRSNMKWVSAKIPNGLKYHSNSGAVATCATNAGCDNPEKEVNTDGTFVTSVSSYPEGTVSGYKSGVINYINKFAYSSGYRANDPMSELYYQVVRYFRNQKPTGSNCSSITTAANAADGFNYYCANSKTTPVAAAGEWRDPALYPCSQSFVIAINDANPWTDKRVPGSAFKANYRNGGTAIDSSNDYCGTGATACDTDFTDGGVQVNVENWVNAIGDWEGLTGTTMNVACEVDASGLCIGGNSTGKNVTISKLGRIIGTPPYPVKENSYNVAGLAYYAHMTDLRPDLAGNKHNLTTFMIDTQEPQGSMLVGPKNMLYLAGKYGGFIDKDTVPDGKPFKDATCGGVNTSPHPLCSEWDEDNDGTPDNYFFASDSSKVESSLNKAFSSILNRATAGTAAAVANNRSGERGANVIQAIFYPSWPLDKSILWLGDVQALWFYLDPLVQYSGIYEDSDLNKELNLDQDRIPNANSILVKALWKSGEYLQARAASTRTIYTLLNAAQPLTNSANTFTTSQRTALKPLLDMSLATDAATDAIINYVRGEDSGSLRTRTVTYNSITGTWKLGDIINSTPQIQGAQAMNAYATDYNDFSYAQFTDSNQYKTNNYVYVGSNDGMLHAFRLGLVETISSTNKFRIAQIIDDTDLGKEEWAYIPGNVLPYLKNCADSSYCHQYLVDGTPLVFDASINKYSDCTADNYWDCPRKTTLSTAKDVDLTLTSWQSVLLGSMGHGGASRDSNCNETLNHDADPANNSDCIKTPVSGSGYSSYFALDITTPLTPKFMWEFSDGVLPVGDRGLGLTTPGPSVVRINPKAGTPPVPVKTANGRWFAVFASGPTGPIDQATRQMKGRSDQNLKIYVLDINPFNTSTTGFVKCTAAGQTNCNYWIKDTGIKYAFAHSLYKSSIDLDRNDSRLDGNYSDDVVYVTYTKATLDTAGVNSGSDWDFGPPYPTAWDKGGILRLVTNNDPDPANWFVSTLIDNDEIGPITSSIDMLQDRINKKLWIFFGEGRYFYTGDDLNTARQIFGVSDPCYRNDDGHANTFYDTSATCPAVTVSQLKNQTSTPAEPLTTEKGWYINLTAAAGSSGAERLYGKLQANTNGVVFYPTFTPSTDICSAGGITSLWAVKYSTGGTPPKSGLKGKLVATTTDTPIPKPINLDGSFTQSGGRKLDSGIVLSGAAGGGGGGVGGSGTMVKNPAPVKRMLNIQER